MYERLTVDAFVAVLPLKRSLEMLEFSLEACVVSPSLLPLALELTSFLARDFQNTFLSPLPSLSSEGGWRPSVLF